MRPEAQGHVYGLFHCTDALDWSCSPHCCILPLQLRLVPAELQIISLQLFVKARGEVVDDGIKGSTAWFHRDSSQEVFSLRHDITEVKALMSVLLVAIRQAQVLIVLI
ncbi:hypothetical protein SELMODRAFT_402829 [Selaginella moellendorffii]|uniref:Uncharacterized protein n=1 Tax=Selaginella moellendorffii TaxID=88036 RepID=D8QN65_SELML|nr:hypothetical protein SELMODRAFT_402829 [Selaginella moellendorffii]